MKKSWWIKILDIYIICKWQAHEEKITLMGYDNKSGIYISFCNVCYISISVIYLCTCDVYKYICKMVILTNYVIRYTQIFNVYYINNWDRYTYSC